MAITLNSKKYQVYISSTYPIQGDLKLEIFEALMELDCIPVGGENFIKGGGRWPDTQSLIDESDYFILFCGSGSKDLNLKQITASQNEYENALNNRCSMNRI